jgi:hypothetical protein
MPTGSEPLTAFPTYRSGTEHDGMTTPAPTGQASPRAAMPDLSTLAPVASQRLQATPRWSRRGLAIAGGVVAVASVVALLVALSGEDEQAVLAPAADTAQGAAEPEPTPVAGGTAGTGAVAAEAREPIAQQPADVDRASGEPAPTPASATPVSADPAIAPASEPAASAVLAVQIESTPPGAAIQVLGKRGKLGVTPYRYKRRADAAVTLGLQLKGYESEQVEVPAGSIETITVTLRRSKREPEPGAVPKQPSKREDVRGTKRKPPIDDEELGWP